MTGKAKVERPKRPTIKRYKGKPPPGYSEYWMITAYQTPEGDPNAGKWTADSITVRCPGGCIHGEEFFDTPQEAIAANLPRMKEIEAAHPRLMRGPCGLTRAEWDLVHEMTRTALRAADFK